MLKFLRGTKGQLLTFAVALTMIFGALSALGWLTVDEGDKLPDLRIEKIQYTPDRPFKNDVINVIATVINQGEANAVNIEVALYIDSRSIPPAYIVHIPSLNQGENTSVNLYWPALLEGDFTLFVWVDYQNKIRETNEENNWESKKVHVEIEEISDFPPRQESQAQWWDPHWHYRLPIKVEMPGFYQDTYQDKMVNVTIDFTALMKELNIVDTATFDPNSISIVEYRRNVATWIPVGNISLEVLYDPNYNVETNANLTIMWIVNGTSKPQSVHHYYLYWDTLDNDEKEKQECEISHGIRNSDFENINCSSWENSTKGNSWRTGYSTENYYTGNQSYKVSREALIWREGQHANVSQNFFVPEGGTAVQYWLHTSLHFDPGSLNNNIKWSIVLDGAEVASGSEIIYGWKNIAENVTTLLRGKYQATLLLKVEVISQQLNYSKIETYWDTCWIETQPPGIIMTYDPTGWWGNITIKNEYIGGVYSRNVLDVTNISTVATPWTVTTYLYNPQENLMKRTLPLPDASFEDKEECTLLYSSEKTAEATFQSGTPYGNSSVELSLHKYENGWWREDEDVTTGDHAALRQNLGTGLPASELPDLWFWYNVSRYDLESYIQFILIATGGPSQHLQIEMGNLTRDGMWNRYDIPSGILETWRDLPATITAIEIRLVATADGIRDTVIKIDNLGCATYQFASQGITDRTIWVLEDLYEFEYDEPAGNWTIQALLADESGYTYTARTPIHVEPAANLEIEEIIPAVRKMEGELVNISLLVRNLGPKNVSSTDVSLTLFQNASETESIRIVQTLGSLNVSEEKEITFTWTALYGKPTYNGEWTVVGQIDPQNQVIEWDETNNWDSSNVTIIAVPDLYIRMNDVNFEPSHPVSNEITAISVITHNMGYENAPQNMTSLTVSYMYDKQEDEQWQEDETIFSTNISVLKLNEKPINLDWVPPQDGYYTFRVAVNCQKELNTNNNQVFKDIRVGGPEDDESPPEIEIVNTPLSPQNFTEVINITAKITDAMTTVDRVSIEILNDEGVAVSDEMMNRVDFTHIYSYTTTIPEIGYYVYTIKAWDTSLLNNQASKQGEIRIVDTNIEANPPEISFIRATPTRQVIGEPVEITAIIADQTGVSEALVYIRSPEGEGYQPHLMETSGSRYYYNSSYEETGEYQYYIWVKDTSLNRNVNTTIDEPGQTFVIPQDYDEDGVPDTIEISAGGNPRIFNDTVKATVTVNGLTEEGYLIWNGEVYKYWDIEEDTIQDTTGEDRDNDGIDEILFDADGDGTSDHYYDIETGDIGSYSPFTPPEEDDWEQYLLVAPLLALLVIISFLYHNIRRNNSR